MLMKFGLFLESVAASRLILPTIELNFANSF